MSSIRSSKGISSRRSKSSDIPCSPTESHAIWRRIAFPSTLGRLRAEQRPIIDLTESNPTRAGFPYPDDLLDPLSDPGRAPLRAGAAGPAGGKGGRRRRLRAPGRGRGARIASCSRRAPARRIRCCSRCCATRATRCSFRGQAIRSSSTSRASTACRQALRRWSTTPRGRSICESLERGDVSAHACAARRASQQSDRIVRHA